MASVFYNIAKKGFADGTIDWDTHTIKAALVSTNTTCDTEEDVDTISGFGTLDEFDATNYARATLGSKTVTADDTNDRAELDAADLSFSSLGGDGTRDVQGLLIYKEVTNDTDNIPIAFFDFTTDLAKEASQMDVTVNAEGLLQLT